MRYLKKFEVIDYNNEHDSEDDYHGNIYLYSEKPLTLEQLKKQDSVVGFIYNKPDTASTSSEYVYQVKTKKPLYYKKSLRSLRTLDDFENRKTPDENNYSGFITNDIITSEQIAEVKTEDIISFKLIGGFKKYDKEEKGRKNIELSKETESFLSSYIGGAIFPDKVTPKIEKELEQFKPDKSIKIFKGIEEVQMIERSDKNPPYKKGDFITTNFNHPSSWTTNIMVARSFIDEEPSSPPYVAMMVAQPKDILVDVQMLPKQYYHANQREIIMKPNAYTFKLVWDDNKEWGI